MEDVPLKQCTETNFEILTNFTGQEHVEILHSLHDCPRYMNNNGIGHLATPTVLVTLLVSVTRYPAKSNVSVYSGSQLGAEGYKSVMARKAG